MYRYQSHLITGHCYPQLKAVNAIEKALVHLFGKKHVLRGDYIQITVKVWMGERYYI